MRNAHPSTRIPPRSRRGPPGLGQSGQPFRQLSAGKLALDNTPEQLQVLKDAGVVDAGGAGFLLLLDSVLYVVDGEPLPVPEPDDGTAGAVGAAFDAVAHRHAAAPGELDVSEQRYEVMYFLDLADGSIDEFKQQWGRIGDSIAVTASGSEYITEYPRKILTVNR